MPKTIHEALWTAASPTSKKQHADALNKALVQALQSPGVLAAMASQLQVAEQRLLRMLDEDQLSVFTSLMAELELKAVPCEHICISPEQFHALLIQARAYLATLSE